MTITCDICQVVFSRRSRLGPTPRYCSAKCRNSRERGPEYREQMRQWHKAHYLRQSQWKAPKTCAECSATFTPAKSSRELYCSTYCQKRADYLRNRWQPPVTKACDQCQSLFTPMYANARWCSKQCGDRWHAQHTPVAHRRAIGRRHFKNKTLSAIADPLLREMREAMYDWHSGLVAEAKTTLAGMTPRQRYVARRQSGDSHE